MQSRYENAMQEKINLLRDKKCVRILALESSCDETAVAIVENGRKILADVVYSQVDLHARFGGVVPEVASRKHMEVIDALIDETFAKAGLALGAVDAVAVTCGPGLVGALLVAVSCAKALAFAWQVPLLGVNHIEGHICANYLAHENLEPPFVALVVSGGHTHILHVVSRGKYILLGQTVDDAAGEAFDKVARVLGLSYPGGPHVETAAKAGNPKAFDFPRAKMKDNPLNFSFSGLKTCVVNVVHNMKQAEKDIPTNDIAASFQTAVIDVLVQNTLSAAQQVGAKTVVLGGGVACNMALKEAMLQEGKRSGITVLVPPISLCGDNAAMIGCAAYDHFLQGEFSDLTLNAIPDMKINYV